MSAFTSYLLLYDFTDLLAPPHLLVFVLLSFIRITLLLILWLNRLLIML